jgi:hypothetical protein
MLLIGVSNLLQVKSIERRSKGIETDLVSLALSVFDVYSQSFLQRRCSLVGHKSRVSHSLICLLSILPGFSPRSEPYLRSGQWVAFETAG